MLVSSEQTIWREESWSRTGDRQEALADFDGWAAPITAILQQAEVLHKWALFDRAPLPQWHDGHVVLIGDAAHPMLPSMAQGAVQSLEDGYHLARTLGAAEGANIPAACARHYAQRIAPHQQSPAGLGGKPTAVSQIQPRGTDDELCANLVGRPADPFAGAQAQ